MTAQAYLQQAWGLDQKIEADLLELENLREMANSVSSAGYRERVNNPSRSTEAPFVRSLEKIEKLQATIDEEIDRMVDLKEQIRKTIASLQNPNEQMVLQFRYVQRMPWERIRAEMFASESSVFGWHKNALDHLVLPEDPVLLQSPE